MSSKIPVNFITNIIQNDINTNTNEGKVITRFPPEPNGFLHIGHAKSICLNFTLAKLYNRGPCHLRFDDTNPCNEKVDYIHAIQNDIHWLGFDWGEHLYYASDYFEQIYQIAIHLIQNGLAYVCSLSAEEVRTYRGTLTEAGVNSPDRERTITDNLLLFKQMRAGKFQEGTYTLRAKIDMASNNMNMRDPALYRIRHIQHHRTGKTWCIYPMYDFTHALSDALEGITHSLCTLEFQDHRPLYNWVIKNSGLKHHPKQYEFSRLNLDHTITSKRKLKTLVENNYVDGWDDPRMPTLQGLRRRGIPPEAIRIFCQSLGVSKQDSIINIEVLESTARDYLNTHTVRRNVILNPLKVTLSTLHEPLLISAPNHPQNPDFGRRELILTPEIYIEQDDFMETPIPSYKRFSPNVRIRLMNGVVIECEEIIKNSNGDIIELLCKHLPETLAGKKPNEGAKPKGVIHWVSKPQAIDAEVRLYTQLFTESNPASFEDFTNHLNPNSIQIIHAKVEPALNDSTVQKEDRFQFNRLGYFCADRYDHIPSEKLVFNQIVSLKAGF